MAEWLVQLMGDKVDLQRLSQVFKDDPTISEEDKDYFLKAHEFDLIQEPSDVHARAKQIIRIIDYIAYLFYRDTDPITIGKIIKVNNNGECQEYVFAEAHLIEGPDKVFATGTLIGADRVEITPSGKLPIIKAFNAANSNGDIDDALRFYCRGDWIDLYKSYEIIRDNIGNDEQVISKHWITRSQLKRFSQTAQSREALGDSARHAAKKFKSPPNSMSIYEARVVIGNLFQKWIESKNSGKT